MTSSPTDRPVRGPVGMPAHLWELARSDVRLSVPERVRHAVANGLNAPEGVRRIAARVAVTGAAMGVPAAMLGLGGFLDTADTPVDLAGGETSLDGAPATPGSYDAGGAGGPGGPGGGHDGGGHDGGGHGSGGHDGGGSADGFASATTHGTGDVQSGLGSTWHVQDPAGESGDWLTVQMFQDVTVTETADGMFVVDAWQFVVIRDDDGNEYVFKEHYQVVVPDPPGEETDLIVHERGVVHVVERPDGTYGVDTDFGIDVSFGADGDGRDEVTIGQTQHVRYTDTDGRTDDDVTVDLSERASSTSEDTGDEATTTIGQDQVFDDGTAPPAPWSGGTRTTDTGPDRPGGDGTPAGERDGTAFPDGGPGATGGTGGVDPSSPFGEEPADRGAGSGGPASAPAASAGTGPSAPSAAGTASAARPVDVPLATATAAAPAATVLGDDDGGRGFDALDGAALRGTGLGPDPAADGPDPGTARTELDAPPSGTGNAPAGPDQPQQPGAPDPFAGSGPPDGQEPFAATGGPGTPAGPDTPDGPDAGGDNTAGPGHESSVDPTDPTDPADPSDPTDPSVTAGETAGQPGGHETSGHDTTDHDPTDHGADGADHALVG